VAGVAVTAPTYRAWSEDVLDMLSAGAPSPGRWRWLVAWAQLEDTDARFNPLATTYLMIDSSRFNAAGVRNYRSLASGVRAVVWTLRTKASERGYDRIVGALLDPKADFAAFRGAVSRSAWSGLPRDGKHYVVPEFDPAWSDRALPGAS